MTDPLVSTRANGTIRSRRATGARKYQHTINGLLTKRSYVMEALKDAEHSLKEVRADMAALDRSLKLLGFADDPQSYMPARKNRRMFKKGEMLRCAYDVLREADGPLSSREICLKLLSDKGFDLTDKKTVNQVTSRVYKALLREQEAGHLVVCKHLRSGTLLWVMAGDVSPAID